jgi:hypothetical protein
MKSRFTDLAALAWLDRSSAEQLHCSALLRAEQHTSVRAG